MDVSQYHQGLDTFLQSLQGSNPSILEIACGPGNLTKYLLQKTENIRIHGIDLAPNMIELAKQNCPKASFEVLDCRHISKLHQKYEGVVAGFCLPYLDKYEASTLLEGISNLLIPGGVLYLSTIEGTYSSSGLKKGSTGDEIFQYYYSLSEIEGFLTKFRFKLIWKQRVSIESNPHQDIDIILIAEKQNGL